MLNGLSHCPGTPAGARLFSPAQIQPAPSHFCIIPKSSSLPPSHSTPFLSQVNGAAGVQNASSAADPVFGTATVRNGARSLQEALPLGAADAKPKHSEYLGGRAQGKGGHPAGKGHHKTYAPATDKEDGGDKKDDGAHNKPAAPAGAFSVTLTVKGPPSGNIAPSGYYWLHVLDQGGAGAGFWVPTAEGAAVKENR